MQFNAFLGNQRQLRFSLSIDCSCSVLFVCLFLSFLSSSDYYDTLCLFFLTKSDLKLKNKFVRYQPSVPLS